MCLDEIEKMARDANGLASYSPETMRALADAVLTLVDVARAAEIHVRQGGMRNAQALLDALSALAKSEET